MLTSLRLHNFQCHQNRLIEFEQVTVLVGGNGNGKSSILRALLFLMLNEWGGRANTHVTFDEYESFLELCIDESTVTRSKGDNTNSYSLDSEVFHAFGAGKVPAPIAQLLNVSIDNFQQQDDPPFWLSLTSGQAASALNDIFCLTSIDDALENVSKELRQAKIKKKVVEERLETARANSKSLLWTKQADKDLKELEELNERISNIKEKIRVLSKTVQEIQGLELLQQTSMRRMELLQQAIESGIRLVEIQARVSFIKEILNLEDKIGQQSKTLLSKQTKLAELMKGKCPLCKRG